MMGIVFAVVGATVLVAALGVALYAASHLRRRLPAMRVRVQQLRRLLDLADRADEELEPAFGRSLWPQIQALVALYRVVDGQPALPLTRTRGAASPDFLLHLTRHIQAHRPATIIECGGGVSTVVMAYALRQLGHGHIHSLEHHPGVAEALQRDLRERGLDAFVTVVVAPLVPRAYDGLDEAVQWYGPEVQAVPSSADLLVVRGPRGRVNGAARYPTAPELFPKLARNAHVFVDEADRLDEGGLAQRWRELYPDLGIRTLDAEKGAIELFFLDHKVESFLRLPVDDE